jgi:hypothetical protein
LIEKNIPEAEFQRPDAAVYQAEFGEWRGEAVTDMIIRKIESKADALNALCSIAAQGEGMDACLDPTLTGEPHFKTFLSIYQERLEEKDPRPIRAIPSNPSTDKLPNPDPDLESGRITHRVARALAQLFNLRYRRLLINLSHTLHLGSDKDASGKETRRPNLRNETFTEMFNLSRITDLLMELPQHEGLETGPPFAAAPFGLPYSLSLPDLELDRWLLQQDQIRAAALLIAGVRKELEDGGGISAELKAKIEARLKILEGRDNSIQTIIEARINELRPDSP